MAVDISLEQAALDNLWMHNSGWIELAEHGGPRFMVKGNGIKVTDSNDVEWIDPNGGYASVNVGYGRTEIADAMREQMLALPFAPKGTITEALSLVSEKIATVAPGSLDRCYPVSGGSEATETAIKIARAYHKRNGEQGRYKIISRRNSYHGATGGVQFAGGNADRSDYEPGYPGMLHVPQPNSWNCELGGQSSSECAVLCAQAVEDLILLHGAETIAAFIGEPISGTASTAVPGAEYWPMVREICDRYGVLLITDEIVCGYGRTGKWFAIENFNIVPDIMATAKGIVSSYFPFAATVARKEISDAFASEGSEFQHTLSFSGHPVGAAAALKNIEIIETENLVENARSMGEYFREQLHDLAGDHQFIDEVRGLGLMNSVRFTGNSEVHEPVPEHWSLKSKLTEEFKARRLVLTPVTDQYMNMAPPLCTTTEDIDEIIEIFDQSFTSVGKELGIP